MTFYDAKVVKKTRRCSLDDGRTRCCMFFKKIARYQKLTERVFADGCPFLSTFSFRGFLNSKYFQQATKNSFTMADNLQLVGIQVLQLGSQVATQFVFATCRLMIV